MTFLTKAIRTLLIIMTLLLALAALEGGIQLLIGFYVPPVEMLNGIFQDFTIPGLALGIIVGGSALTASILSMRRNRFATVASLSAGVIIMFFEFVEMLVIGSPAGPARFMQIFFFGMGTLIIILSVGTLFLELLSERKAEQHVAFRS